MKNRTLVAVAVLLFVTVAVVKLLDSQNPSTPNAPISALNAKYVLGVSFGYWVTKRATGLTLDVTAGSAFCSGVMVSYSGGTLTATNSATNYIRLDPASSCSPAISTTIFAAGDVPLAVCTASGGNVSSCVEDRTPFVNVPAPPAAITVTGAGSIAVSGGPDYLVSCGTCGTDSPNALYSGMLVGSNFSVNGTVQAGGTYRFCSEDTARSFPADYMPFPVSGYLRNPTTYVTALSANGTAAKWQTQVDGISSSQVWGSFLFPLLTVPGTAGSSTSSWRVEQGEDAGIAVASIVGLPSEPGYGYEFVADGAYDAIYCTVQHAADTGTFTIPTNNFFGPFGSNGGVSSTTTEAQTEVVVPYAGTFSKMFFYLSTVNGAGGSDTITFRKNGANCGLTKTITTDATGVYADTTNNCTVAAGDTVNFEAACTGNTCGHLYGISIAFTASSGGCGPSTTTACKAVVGSAPNFTATVGTTNYSSPFSKNINTTEANQRIAMSRGGTLELCAAYVAAAGAGNTTTLTIMTNGSAGSSTVVIGPGVSG